MQCKRPECVEEWKEYVSDEEENARVYSEGSYTITHCEKDNCHNIYPKGKNGWTCTLCHLEVCENCESDGKWDHEVGEFYCSEECWRESLK